MNRSKTNMSGVDVSVIIPAYNCSAYISQTLLSVFLQTVRPAAVIVVDDGSTDDLESALAPYRDRIVYIRKSNGGTASARNEGILAANTQLVAFLDGDDLWFPDTLETQLRCLNESGADMVYGDCIFLGSYYDGKRFMELFPSQGPVTLEALLWRRCNVVVSVLAHRSAVIRAGLFDCNIKGPEDFDMWVRMAACGCTIAYHRKPVMKYRREGQGKTSEEIQNLRSEMALYRKFLRILPGSRATILRRMWCINKRLMIALLKEVGRTYLPGPVLNVLRKPRPVAAVAPKSRSTAAGSS